MKKLKEILQNNKVYFLYFIFFVVMTVGVYYIYLKQKMSFIYNTDGMNQHFLILFDFNEMVRNILENGFSTFSLNIGLGLDIIGQYSYYILGDLFAIISFFFPLDKLHYAYSLMIVARIFCIGIAFIIFCRYKKKKCIPTLIGALIYCFSGYVLFAGIRHPYFINALILLPLILIGVEKLIKENKKILFIFMIFISAFSNYYFFYMLTIIAIIYGAFTYIFECKDKNIKGFFKLLLKAAACYILGILMSEVILLPSIYAFLNSSRESTQVTLEYTQSFYHNFLMSYINMPGKGWTVIQVSIVCIPFIGLLICNWKENKKSITLLIVMTIMLLLPQVGSLMNGFSYPTNRWSFAYSFILAYIVTSTYKTDFSYTKKELLFMFIFTSIFINLVYMFANYNKLNFQGLFTAIIFILLFGLILFITYFIRKIKREKIKKVCMKILNVCVILVVMGSIISQANHYYKNIYINYFNKYSKIKSIYRTERGLIDNFDDAIKYIKEHDNTVYRIAKYPISIINTSILYNYNGISSYYSIANKYLYNFIKELEINNYTQTQIYDYNNRTSILEMLGVKYLISDEENLQYVPYGYSLFNQIGNTQIYINNYYLGLGLFYDKYITQEQYDNLTAIEKQIALLEYAKVEENIDNVEKGIEENLENKLIEIEYSVISEENKKIELEMKEKINGELYVVIDNVQFEPTIEGSSTEYKIKAVYGNYASAASVLNKTAAYYIDRDSFVLNLGQVQDNKNVKIQFASADGEIKYDDIKLIVIPNEEYEKQVADLSKTKLENIQYNGNTISGEINNEKNGILQLSVPYSEGWKVYVDGEEKEVLNVNTGFIGVELEKGSHEITFSYTTPGLNAGIALTIIGFIMFIVFIIYERKRKRE